ncbi:hypothetical protein KFE19_16495 [Dysosmobacter sp. Marseille-Q4140]|nr:hypothetical protein KFE19_16495 [Dysosmobacter sp. Marseille-Q4140]
MFPTILAALIGALAGAFLRFDIRKDPRAWLLTAALAAAGLALLFLTPRGQELCAIWAFLFAAAAAGALLCGAGLRLRR